MNMFHNTYLLLAGTLSCGIALHTKNKAFVFLLVFWILSEPVLSSAEYIISVPGIIFDFHLNRIYLFLFGILIILKWFKYKKRPVVTEKFHFHPHEKWLFLYILSVIVSLAINYIYSKVDLKETLVISTSQMYFFIFYFATKLWIDSKAFKILVNTLIFFSVVSTLLVLFHMFISKEIFWFGSHRIAFSDIYRANSIFHTEYTMAFFHISVILLLLVLAHPHRRILVGINVLPVLLSFHRLSIITLLGVLGYFVFSIRRKRLIFFSTASISFVIFSMFLLNSLFSVYDLSQFTKTSFYSERLTLRTLYERSAQGRNAIFIMYEHLFGVGTYNSEIYLRYAESIGQASLKPVYDTDVDEIIGIKPYGIVVHNGFLAAGAKYGIFGMVSFTLFCLSTFITFYKRYEMFPMKKYLLPASLSLLWIFFNISQDFSELWSYHALLYAVLLAASCKAANYGESTRRHSRLISHEI